MFTINFNRQEIAAILEHEILGKMGKDVNSHLLRAGIGNDSTADKSAHKTGGGMNKHFIGSMKDAETGAVSLESKKGLTVVHKDPEGKGLLIHHKHPNGQVSTFTSSVSLAHKKFHELHGITDGTQTHSDIKFTVHGKDDSVGSKKEFRKDRLKPDNSNYHSAPSFNKRVDDRVIASRRDRANSPQNHHENLHNHAMKMAEAIHRGDKDAFDRLHQQMAEYGKQAFTAKNHANAADENAGEFRASVRNAMHSQRLIRGITKDKESPYYGTKQEYKTPRPIGTLANYSAHPLRNK